MLKSEEIMKLLSEIAEASRQGDLAALQALVESDELSCLTAADRSKVLGMCLLSGASSGSQDTVDFLIASGADVDFTNPETGTTPLINAAFAGYDAIVASLVAVGADVNTAHKEGVTALMLAAAKCSPATVATLLEAGADPHATSSDGLTAMKFAFHETRGDNVLVLRDYPAVRSSIRE